MKNRSDIVATMRRCFDRDRSRRLSCAQVGLLLACFLHASFSQKTLANELTIQFPRSALEAPENDPPAESDGKFTYALSGIFFPADQRVTIDPGAASPNVPGVSPQAVTLLKMACAANAAKDVAAYVALCTAPAATAVLAVSERADVADSYRLAMAQRSKVKIVAVFDAHSKFGSADKVLLVDYGVESPVIYPHFIKITGGEWKIDKAESSPFFDNLMAVLETHPELVAVTSR